MFFEPCYPLIRGNVARIRNLTPTYDAISIQFPSFFFLFLRAPERERDREREVRFYPESIAYPIPIPAFQVRRISAERTATLHFAVQTREVWTFSDRKHQSSPPSFEKVMLLEDALSKE